MRRRKVAASPGRTSLTFLSLFTGVGGFDLGFQNAGMECLGQIEIDPVCQRVLERHWPGKLKGNDVTTYHHSGEIPDVICGGFPCQDLSLAGKRQGLGGKRSGLFFAFLKIIRRLKPRWIIVENVPGLLSSWTPLESPPRALDGRTWDVEEGSDFETVLTRLSEVGYCLAAGVLDSQYFGVPQRRNRVFLIGSLGDAGCVEVFFEPESVPGHPPPRRAPGQDLAGTLTQSFGSGGADDNRAQQGLYVAHALTCHAAKGGDPTTDNYLACPPRRRPGAIKAYGLRAANTSSNGWGVQEELIHTLDVASPHRVGTAAGVRRLTPRECERLQGFPDDWTRWDDRGKEISDSARYRMLGNAVTERCARWLGRRLMAAH